MIVEEKALMGFIKQQCSPFNILNVESEEASPSVMVDLC